MALAVAASTPVHCFYVVYSVHFRHQAPPSVRFAPPKLLFSPQLLKHRASTSLERNKMNSPTNLLFDIEVAKSRLEEVLKPSVLSNEWRKTANDQVEQSSP